ncbi:MAG: hypothetical protein QOJ03_848, partial [Frankiaceae bacterium]|nr:hypothetical protein [Frankiaceae bacterium]
MTPAQARSLLAAPELLAAASATDLRTGERLRETWSADLVAAASEQAALRQRAAEKFGHSKEMLFTRAGLEQATAEIVAGHRARRFTGLDGLVLDLCCGIGGDAVALAQAARDVVGVDRDQVHAMFTRHNARVHDIEMATVVADVRDVRVDGARAVFIDPARRTTSGLADTRGGSSPPLDWCVSLPVERVCVKAAPGLHRSVVPEGWEVEFVAVGRDLKEAVLWSPSWGSPAWGSPARRSAASRATVLPAGDTLTADPTTAAAPVRPPGDFLLDPSPAVTRAGAVADLAARLDAWQIDPRIAF